MKRHFFLVAALAVLALMAVAAGLKLASSKARSPVGGPVAGAPGPRGPGGGALQVTVTTAQPRTFVDSIEVLGIAKGRRSVTLTAAATQLVEAVRFLDGASVPRGAVLVELKQTEEDAELAQAQARLVQAERAYQRWRTLGDKGFASKSSIDQHQAAYLSALADVKAAQARRGDRLIRAPFSGVVGLSDIAPGALVNPGAPIATLDDLSAVRVDFPVPEQYLAQLHEGQHIQARADAYPGETIAGRIARLDTRIDERTRSITARAEFPNAARRLKPGMLMRVSIARGSREAVAAPESAVAVQGDSAFVYVVHTEGQRATTEQRPVITGVRQDGFVEIRDGLQPGERVVADGLNRVQPGQPVRVAAPPAASTSIGRRPAA